MNWNFFNYLPIICLQNVVSRLKTLNILANKLYNRLLFLVCDNTKILLLPSNITYIIVSLFITRVSEMISLFLASSVFQLVIWGLAVSIRMNIIYLWDKASAISTRSIILAFSMFSIFSFKLINFPFSPSAYTSSFQL